MSLFDSLNPQPVSQQEALRQMKANPCEMMKRAGYNVPAGMNNPQQIINHLLQSGQVGNSRLQMLMQMLRR